MNKSILKYGLILVLAIGMGFILFLSFQTFNVIKDSKSNDNEEGRLLYYGYMNQVYMSVMDDNTAIENPEIIKYIQRNNLFSTPILVINYSNLSCSSCLNYLLHGLEKQFPGYAVDKQILFVATEYRSESEKKYGNTIFLPYGENLQMESGGGNEPFLFVLVDGKAIHVFTPNSPYDELFETYLTAIQERYFSDN